MIVPFTAPNPTFPPAGARVMDLQLVDKKMSKSLGNVFTIQDVVDRGVRASTLRYLLMSVHYRKQLTFSWDILEQAENAVRRIADFLDRLDLVSGDVVAPALGERLGQAKRAFHEAMAERQERWPRAMWSWYEG